MDLFTLMHNLYLNQRRALPPMQTLDIDEFKISCPARSVPVGRCAGPGALSPAPAADQRAVLLLVAMEDMGYEDTAHPGHSGGHRHVTPVAGPHAPARAHEP